MQMLEMYTSTDFRGKYLLGNNCKRGRRHRRKETPHQGSARRNMRQKYIEPYFVKWLVYIYAEVN